MSICSVHCGGQEHKQKEDREEWGILKEREERPEGFLKNQKSCR